MKTTTIESRPGQQWPVEVTTKRHRPVKNGPEVITKYTKFLDPSEVLRRRMVDMLRDGAKSDASLPFRAAALLAESYPDVSWAVWLLVHTGILEEIRIATIAQQETNRDHYRTTGRGKRAARQPSEADFLIALREHLPEIANAAKPFKQLRFFASQLAQRDTTLELSPREQPGHDLDSRSGSVFSQVPDVPCDADLTLCSQEASVLNQERHRLQHIAKLALERALLPRLSADGANWFRLHDQLNMPKRAIQDQTAWSDRDYSRLQKEVSRAKHGITAEMLRPFIAELGTTPEEMRSSRASSALG